MPTAQKLIWSQTFFISSTLDFIVRTTAAMRSGTKKTKSGRTAVERGQRSITEERRPHKWTATRSAHAETRTLDISQQHSGNPLTCLCRLGPRGLMRRKTEDDRSDIFLYQILAFSRGLGAPSKTFLPVVGRNVPMYTRCCLYMKPCFKAFQRPVLLLGSGGPQPHGNPPLISPDWVKGAD